MPSHTLEQQVLKTVYVVRESISLEAAFIHFGDLMALAVR